MFDNSALIVSLQQIDGDNLAQAGVQFLLHGKLKPDMKSFKDFYSLGIVDDFGNPRVNIGQLINAINFVSLNKE